MGFLLSSPRVTDNCEFRRNFESAFKMSNGLSGFDSLLFSGASLGYLFPCQCPPPEVQRGEVVSPRSQSQLWGTAKRHPYPLPSSVLSGSHFLC